MFVNYFIVLVLLLFSSFFSFLLFLFSKYVLNNPKANTRKFRCQNLHKSNGVFTEYCMTQGQILGQINISCKSWPNSHRLHSHSNVLNNHCTAWTNPWWISQIYKYIIILIIIVHLVHYQKTQFINWITTVYKNTLQIH